MCIKAQTVHVNALWGLWQHLSVSVLENQTSSVYTEPFNVFSGFVDATKQCVHLKSSGLYASCAVFAFVLLHYRSSSR